jgi:hypothetical protein
MLEGCWFSCLVGQCIGTMQRGIPKLQIREELWAAFPFDERAFVLGRAAGKPARPTLRPIGKLVKRLTREPS